MYVELTGTWIDGPVESDLVPPDTAKQIDWPQAEQGTIAVNLIDQNGQPVDLVIGSGDSITLSLGLIPRAPIRKLTGTADTKRRGRYLIAVGTNDTGDLAAGLLIYDVWVTRSSVSKQVVRTSYFNTGIRVLT